MSTGLDDKSIRKSQNGRFLPDAMASNSRFSVSFNVFSACKYAKDSSCNACRPFLLYFPKGRIFLDDGSVRLRYQFRSTVMTRCGLSISRVFILLFLKLSFTAHDLSVSSLQVLRHHSKVLALH